LSRPISSDRAAGFTLIEVLVVLAVLVASLPAIGALVAVNVKGTRATEEHLVMTQTVRAILNSLPDRRDLNVGAMSGETGGFRWRLDVAPYAGGGLIDPRVATPWVPLSMVLTVESPGGRRLQVSTVRLRRRPDG
jgi:prepilin-type N-terminal cleavage/methylation domain-containing protein